MSEPWFGPKTYGIGIGPKSRAGWVSVAVYLVLALATPIVGLSLNWPAWVTPIALAIFTVSFLILIIAKSRGDGSDGEPWRWRWGGR